MKYLIYCTKAKPYIIQARCVYAGGEKGLSCFPTRNKGTVNALNGKVVAEFDGDIDTYTVNEDWYSKKVQVICKHLYGNVGKYETMDKELLKEVLEKSCLTREALTKYIIPDGKCHDMYCINIKNRKKYEKPKQLTDYHRFRKCNSCKVSGYESSACLYDEDCIVPTVVEKAPQNMMRVYDKNGQEYILISIRPKWVEKILNGEKTIEIRKSVLKVNRN